MEALLMVPYFNFISYLSSLALGIYALAPVTHSYFLPTLSFSFRAPDYELNNYLAVVKVVGEFL